MDETPVIACDMTGAADTPQERMAEYGRLFGAALVGRERTTDGIRFRLRADTGVEAWVRDLAAREKACCPFFDFAVSAEGGEVRWDATVLDDDTARAVLDEFYRLPETAVDGVEGLSDRLATLGFAVTADEAGTVTEVRPAADRGR
jgi:hypothetical protein